MSNFLQSMNQPPQWKVVPVSFKPNLSIGWSVFSLCIWISIHNTVKMYHLPCTHEEIMVFWGKFFTLLYYQNMFATHRHTFLVSAYKLNNHDSQYLYFYIQILILYGCGCCVKCASVLFNMGQGGGIYQVKKKNQEAKVNLQEEVLCCLSTKYAFIIPMLKSIKAVIFFCSTISIFSWWYHLKFYLILYPRFMQANNGMQK